MSEPDPHSKATLLDGKQTAASLRARLAAELESLGNPQITLATVLVGEDAASQLYVGMKQRQAEAVGMQSHHVGLPESVSQRALEETIHELVANPVITGILIQLPLPDGIDANAVIDLVVPEKDVDGLTSASLGRLLRSQPGLVPCTPLGVMRLLQAYGIATQGKRAVIVGRSMLVGLPQVLLLAARGVDATVTLAHSRTEDLKAITHEADILVAAAGSPGMITVDHVKQGATVFDVGVTRTDDGIQGDVDFASVQPVAGALTPMPGGTGPMTVACLLENTLSAARMQGVIPPEPRS